MTPTAPGTNSAYRLQPGSPPVEVISVIRGRALSAIGHLRGANPEGQSEAVHEARKDAKKIRAALRLVRGELGEERFRSENRRFRDAARLLAGMRDTEVMAGTVAAMINRYPERAGQLAPLNRELRSRAEQLKQGSVGGDAEARLKMAADGFANGVAVVTLWQLDDHGWDSYGAGLRRTYRDGRRGLRAVEDRLETGRIQEAAGDVHEWRKRVKDLWYQLRLLRDAWKEGLAGLVGEVDRLAELLGEFNDFAVLERELESSRLSGFQDEVVNRLAAVQEKELLDSALPLGRLIYSEKPSRFSDRIGGYWQA